MDFNEVDHAFFDQYCKIRDFAEKTNSTPFYMKFRRGTEVVFLTQHNGFIRMKEKEDPKSEFMKVINEQKKKRSGFRGKLMSYEMRKKLFGK